MSSFFSSDGSFSLQFAIIFVVIFLILAGVVFAFRRLTGKGMTLSSKAGARGRPPRLGIVDIYELDRQRQLILLRRDNVEHLLLVGGPNDVVIERNINRTMGARLPAEDLPDPDALLATAPAYESTPGYEPQAAYEAKPAPYLEPSFEMPVVVPAPPPGSEVPVPSTVRPLADIVIPRESGATGEPVPEPVENPAPRRPASRLAGAIRRSPPSLVNLVPGATALRGRLPDEAEAPAEANEPAEPVTEPAAPPSDIPGGRHEGEATPVAPSVVAPPAARKIDAAILSDMARQLEEALRRPSAAVRSSQPPRTEPDLAPNFVASVSAEPAASVEPPPEPQPAIEPHSEPNAVDPMAAAMAAPPESPVRPDHPAEPEPNADPDEMFAAHDPEPVPFTAPDVPPEPAPEEPPAPVFVAPPPKVEVAEREPEKPAPPPKPIIEPPAPAKPAQPSPNPFSVEEIEAEFARLLGRPLDRKN